MPRFLFYVNENPTQKHITGHRELKGPCNHVFQQLLSGNTTMSVNISRRNNCIKIAETANSYWLLIWSDSYHNAKNNTYLRQIASRLGVPINDCKHCC